LDCTMKKESELRQGRHEKLDRYTKNYF